MQGGRNPSPPGSLSAFSDTEAVCPAKGMFNELLKGISARKYRGFWIHSAIHRLPPKGKLPPPKRYAKLPIIGGF
jgi:hypothetical protein